MPEPTQRGVIVPTPNEPVTNGAALVSLIRRLGLSVDVSLGGLGAAANLSPEVLAVLEGFDAETDVTDSTVAALVNNSASDVRAALTRTGKLPVGQGELVVSMADYGTSRSAFLNALNDGADIVYFPPGEYDLTGNAITPTKRITLAGAGRGSTVVKLSTGFRIAHGIDVRGISFVCPSYSTNNRAFQVDYGAGLSEDVSGFYFDGCSFDGFFYATYMAGADYSDASDPDFTPDGYVRDVKITNCTSRAPSGSNAGHFQHLVCQDVVIAGCSTYGGQNASSYNFIGGNGLIRVANNYDQNNSYAACEIENFSGEAAITGNVFGGMIWVDDSTGVSITGNTVAERIRLTIQSGDLRDIAVVGNVASRAAVTRFGDAGDQNSNAIADNIMIAHNVFRGGGGATWGVLLQDQSGRIRDVEVAGNLIAGEYATGAIGVVRNANMYARVLLNRAATSDNNMTISGSGGTVHVFANTGVTHSGTRERMVVNTRELQFTDGVTITQPNGTVKRIYVDNSGTLLVGDPL